MIRKQYLSIHFVRCVAAASLLVFFQAFSAIAQDEGGTTNRNRDYYGGSVVGGVEVNAEGILAKAPKKTMDEVGKTLARLLEPIPGDLGQEAPIRKISLKKLDASMNEVVRAGKEFPDTIRYLGGLTAIRYIVVVPEENDILLVGPSEAWKVDSTGNVVGKTSGRPVLRLEDLITIFRTWHGNERPSVITCSIDPTPEALAKATQVQRQFSGAPPREAEAFRTAMEDAYGMNVVTIQGVPENSRFAKILVAADYKMKRIGLGQEPSMVRGLPSYTSLISGSQWQTNPRFWLAPEYGTITHDSKKLIWQLSEVKVKALTEDEYIDTRTSTRQSSGRTDKAAVAWCNKMNANYTALSKVDPVFGDLKNCMELAIAVALIEREGLMQKAGCKLPTMTDEAAMKPLALPAPKYVPSRGTIVKSGRSVVIATGGVEVNPFKTLEGAKLDTKIDAQRTDLTKTSGDAWWSK